MAPSGLEKEVTPPSVDPQLASLKKKIDFLQVQYAVLFIASLVLLLSNIARTGEPLYMHVLWAAALGAAVITRLVRTSYVHKYNALLMGGAAAPLS